MCSTCVLCTLFGSTCVVCTLFGSTCVCTFFGSMPGRSSYEEYLRDSLCSNEDLIDPPVALPSIALRVSGFGVTVRVKVKPHVRWTKVLSKWQSALGHADVLAWPVCINNTHTINSIQESVSESLSVFCDDIYQDEILVTVGRHLSTTGDTPMVDTGTHSTCDTPTVTTDTHETTTCDRTMHVTDKHFSSTHVVSSRTMPDIDTQTPVNTTCDPAVENDSHVFSKHVVSSPIMPEIDKHLPSTHETITGARAVENAPHVVSSPTKSDINTHAPNTHETITGAPPVENASHVSNREYFRLRVSLGGKGRKVKLVVSGGCTISRVIAKWAQKINFSDQKCVMCVFGQPVCETDLVRNVLPNNEETHSVEMRESSVNTSTRKSRGSTGNTSTRKSNACSRKSRGLGTSTRTRKPRGSTANTTRKSRGISPNTSARGISPNNASTDEFEDPVAFEYYDQFKTLDSAELVEDDDLALAIALSLSTQSQMCEHTAP